MYYYWNGSTAVTSSSATSIETITVNVPAPGNLIIHSTGRAEWGDYKGGTVQTKVATVSGCSTWYTHSQADMNNTPTSTAYAAYWNYAGQGVHFGVSAGTKTYYLCAKRTQDNGTATNPNVYTMVTVAYYPGTMAPPKDNDNDPEDLISYDDEEEWVEAEEMDYDF